MSQHKKLVIQKDVDRIIQITHHPGIKFQNGDSGAEDSIYGLSQSGRLYYLTDDLQWKVIAKSPSMVYAN